jgi:fatty acid desaturase
MILRHRRDVQTLVWASAMPLVSAVQYARPALVPYLFPLSCYLALCAGVIAHNHNHYPTFHQRPLNRLFEYWLSIFYGYPTFAWVPTHNLNHHHFVNRPGDATATWRRTNSHDLWTAVTYFFFSSYWQQEPTSAFIRKARAGNRPVYRRIILQYSCWAGGGAALLAVAWAIHGAATGLYVWGIVTVAPAVFALWTIMLFNYEQHVHADAWSDRNHSRSWTGFVNVLLFNNGYHAAHHEEPGRHWSELPAVHARLAPDIDPSLLERSMVWYFLRCYLIAPLAGRQGTTQLGRAPFDTADRP